MKEEVKKAWLEKLKTAKKGKGYLKRVDGTQCCLGVLADVVAETIPELRVGWGTPTEHAYPVKCLGIPYNSIFLPETVLSKVGIDRETSGVLANMNDATEDWKDEVIPYIEGKL